MLKLNKLCALGLALATITTVVMTLVLFGKMPGRTVTPAASAILQTPDEYPAFGRAIGQQPSKSKVQAAFRRFYPMRPRRWAELVHWLRLWGGSEEPSTEEMLSLVYDADKTVATFGVAVHVASPAGLSFAAMDPVSRQNGEPHRDKTLCVLGGLGVSADHPITVGTSQFTVKDIVLGVMNNASLDQELPFTAIALCHYAPTGDVWLNKFGQKMSLEEICDHLCLLGTDEGACFGIHNLYALSVLVRADDRRHILSPTVHQRAAKVIASSLRRLEELHASAGGAFNLAWVPPSRLRRPLDQIGARERGIIQLVVEGHLLEWLAMTPDNLLLQHDMAPLITSSLDDVSDAILRATPDELAANFGPYSHAVNALRLWCPEAWEAWRAMSVTDDPTNHIGSAQ